jgi:hypothetical protein
MQPHLRFRVIWQDADLVEIEVTASNIAFHGSTTVYTTYDALQQFVGQLRGFPQTLASRVTYQAGEPAEAGGYSYMRADFHCFDDLGHSAAGVTIESNTRGRDRAEQKDQLRCKLQFEPAALDRFVAELDRMIASESGEACLDGIAPYTQNIATKS